MTAADRLAEIEARANAATHGPWTRWKHPLGTKTMDFVGAPSLRGDGIPFSVAERVLGRDAEFIAAARQDVPALTNALRAVLQVADLWGRAGISVSAHIHDAIEEALR